MRDRRRTREDRRHRKESIPMTIPLAYAAVAARRSPPALPFGWGAVTVLLVGALFTIIGIVIILYAFFGFITGTIGSPRGRWRVEHPEHLHGRGHPVRDRRCPRRH